MIRATRVTTLYESVLGDRFAELPPVLRRFHARSGALAHGVLRVQRGRGLIARIAGAVMGTPPPSDGVAVELRVTIEDGREVWTRQFASPRPGGHTMVTRQWREGVYLVEAVGPTRTFFELQSEPEGFCFVQRRCAILGIPLPLWLAPHAHARAWSVDPDSWEVEVRVSLPIVGLLVEYAGRLTPDP
jgi:hypothetical protein